MSQSNSSQHQESNSTTTKQFTPYTRSGTVFLSHRSFIFPHKHVFYFFVRFPTLHHHHTRPNNSEERGKVSHFTHKAYGKKRKRSKPHTAIPHSFFASVIRSSHYYCQTPLSQRLGTRRRENQQSVLSQQTDREPCVRGNH